MPEPVIYHHLTEQPLPGEIIAVNGVTYEFVEAGALTGKHRHLVYIGATIVDTRAHLLWMSRDFKPPSGVVPGHVVPSPSMKMMDIRDFRAEGYLQELNRLLLHPVGLALVVEVDDETGEERISGVWDCRDDEEGIAFSNPPDIPKANRVLANRQRLALVRRVALGFVVQPLRETDSATPSAEELIARLQEVANAGSSREAMSEMTEVIADGWHEGWLEQP